jgi:acyl-CoA synthetase (AMP-forming)/AMP-acid ligase II
MNLGSVLSRAAGHFRDRRALTCAGESRTFAEIDRNSNRFGDT